MTRREAIEDALYTLYTAGAIDIAKDILKEDLNYELGEDIIDKLNELVEWFNEEGIKEEESEENVYYLLQYQGKDSKWYTTVEQEGSMAGLYDRMMNLSAGMGEDTAFRIFKEPEHELILMYKGE